MKWLFLLLPFFAQAQYLKPGIYTNLKLSEPIVLDTGCYTFSGLEMHDLGEGIWLDGRKAREMVLLNCRFEGHGTGTGVVSSGTLVVQHCRFTSMACGIWSETDRATTQTLTLTITGNTFTDLATSISLNRIGEEDPAVVNLTMRCNNFEQTTPIPTGNTHFGLVIGENASLFQNRIGGSPGTDPVGSPNANRWPLSSLTWNSTTTPTTIDGFVSIWNQTEDDIEYWKYDNEFFGAVSNTNGGSILPQTLSGGNQETYVYSAKDLCQRSSDFCGETDLPDCIQAVQANNSCPGYTFPIEINWVRACEGSVVDVVDWPIYVPKPTIPLGDLLTNQLTIEIQPDLQLGIGKPNPANRIIQIPYFLPEKSGKAEFWVTEVSTGKLKEVIKLEKVGPGMLEINLDGYNNGVFAYKLIPEKGKASQTLKFVVIQ